MNLRKFLLALPGLMLSWTSSAQFVETFSDDDFTTAPTWQGDGSRFVVMDNRLRLQAPAVTGSASLATPSQALHEATWEFTLQMDFVPSSTNYAKVFLAADRPSIQGEANGYFIKVGHSTREVSLYRQTGTMETEIIDGSDDRVNQPVVLVRIRVTRTGAGIWELFCDVGNTGVFTREGTAADQTHGSSDWVVIQCVYTATRSDKFWLDDFAVTGTRIPDTTPPDVIAITSTDPARVYVSFSEPVVSSSVLTSHILIPGVGNPVDIQSTGGGWGVVCTLGTPLTNGGDYVIHLSGFADSSGNVMPQVTRSVRYFKPGTVKPKVILISEIFADPSPQIGLPGEEYVELYNVSDEPFDLGDWTLTDGNSTGKFPAAILLPGRYLVVTTASGAGSFPGMHSIGLANFPSLNNSGDRLLLRDATGMPVDSVNYALDWYRDEDKAGGGWSLELIDPHNPCGEGDNWSASENEKGGTPGMPNSILATKPDMTAPLIISARAMDSVRIVVQFNERLQLPSLQDMDAVLKPATVVTGVAMRSNYREIEINLSGPLSRRTSYALSLEGVRDCNGNEMLPAMIEVGLPEPADSLDILVSEVLFNPRSGGVDFVEVYNASDKFLDLEGWIVSNGDDLVSLPPGLLAPRKLLAMSPDPDIVRSQYPACGSFLQVALPSFPDEQGNVWLMNPGGRIMEKLSYHREWHSVFLASDEGVSLERIDYAQLAESKDNWTSAGSLSGYATPGLVNTQARGASHTTGSVIVEPEVFVPENSMTGFAQVHYHFEQPGSVANVTVLDVQGRPIKSVAENVLLGREGFFRWDGDRNDGSRAVPGYYVLWFERFDPYGHTETFRKRIVIGWP